MSREAASVNFATTPGAVTRNERAREAIAHRGRNDLFYLASVILGYDRLRVETHGPLCRFFDTCKLKRRLFLMPRSHFKSSIITISGTIKLIINDPNVRVLLAAATHENASRFLEEIKRHFSNNEFFRWLYPEVCWENPRSDAPRWNKFEMEVPRTTFVREPTVDTIGARGEVVSRHYTNIVLDDPIGEQEYQSPTEMKKTCEWLAGVESLLVPPFEARQIDMVGTRWKLDDVYAFFEFLFGGSPHDPATVIGPHAYRKRSLAVFSRSVIEDGKPIFPEEFSLEQLTNLQRADPNRYAAQYVNDPLAEGNIQFSPKWLKYFKWVADDKILLEDEDKPILITQYPVIIVCDPSMGKTRKADKTAIHVLLYIRAREPAIVMLESVIKRMRPDQIIQQLFDFYDKYNWTRLVSVETVAFQEVLKHWIIREEVIGGRIPLPIYEYQPGSKGKKSQRIKGLIPVFRSGQFYLQPGFTDFIDEYTRWHDDAQQDDGMDALAQILEHIDFGWTEENWSAIEEFDRLMAESRSALTGY